MKETTSNDHRALIFRLIFVLLMFVIVSGTFAAKWYFDRPTTLQKAEFAFQQGHVEEGRSQLLEHLNSHPTDDDARWTLASSYARSSPEIAIGHLQKIGAGSEHFRDAQRSIYLIASNRSRYDEAERALDLLLEINPQDFGSKLAKAELYYQGKRYRDALPLIQDVINADPTRAESFLLLADNFFELDRVTEAIAPLRSALKINPDSMTAHANLAYALHFSGELEEAEKESLWCLNRDIKLHQVRTILAKIYRDQGKFEAALEEVNKSLKADPEYLTACILKAEILMFLQRAGEAYSILEPLYQNHSRNRELLSNLSRAATASGNRDAARKYQLKLAEEIKSNPRYINSSSIPIQD